MPTPPNDVGAVPPLTEPPRIVNPNRRRDKPQLSCNLCRRRKLRCDRQHPCSCCTARGLACTYPEKSQASGPAAHLPKPAAMYDRIVQLERLVKSIVPDPKTGSLDSASDLASRFASLTGSAGAGIAPSISKLSIADPPKPLDVRSEYGSMRVSPSELRYVGGDHWAAILDNIADLKDHFDREEQDELAAPSDSQQGSDAVEGQLDDVVETDLDRLAVPQSTHALLLYGCPLPTSRSEILAALPPKSAVDRYISRYFGRLDIVHSIVHGPTFLNQYNAFWENPSGVSIIWIGLLFSMMCLAVVASDASDMAHGDPEHRSVQVAIYREKTVQCLLAGEYTKTGAYVLETIINYIYLELGVRGKDAGKDVWFLYALELNLAMRMGYHRDPIHYPDLTPLQAEMRRRLWATVLQGDILVSSQMGMPRMINDWKYDITEPRNLRDEDLNEEMTELPPVRPETELTPALGVIARRRMFVALGAVSDITATCQPCSYDEIMRVDKIFSEAIASIPEPLQPKPIAASMMDRAEVIMARMFLAHLSAKGQIMLHRRFLHVESPSSQEEDPYAYSRDVCLDAALRGLEIQHVLDEETRPGGQLYMMRWRVSSIMNSMFLTATMVLCSMLYRGPQTDQQQRQQIRRKEEILAALRRTRTIWMGAAARGSREGKKAAETVSFVLAKAGVEGATLVSSPPAAFMEDGVGMYPPQPPQGPPASQQQGMAFGAPVGSDPTSAMGSGSSPWSNNVARQDPLLVMQQMQQQRQYQPDGTTVGDAASLEQDQISPGLLGALNSLEAQGQDQPLGMEGLTADGVAVGIDIGVGMGLGTGMEMGVGGMGTSTTGTAPSTAPTVENMGWALEDWIHTGNAPYATW